MKLTDLNPRWIHENVFVFDCPHCRKTLLSCKNIAMDISTQFDIFVAAFGEGNAYKIVPMKRETAWGISGKDFANMTVTPSIDASASGHWHGFIKDGMIT